MSNQVQILINLTGPSVSTKELNRHTIIFCPYDSIYKHNNNNLIHVSIQMVKSKEKIGHNCIHLEVENTH